MVSPRWPRGCPRLLTAIVLGRAFAGSGCGSNGGQGQEPIPVLNPKPTSPMSGIDPSNEAEHLDKLKGTMAPRR
jgi:hypothetical protein